AVVDGLAQPLQQRLGEQASPPIRFVRGRLGVSGLAELAAVPDGQAYSTSNVASNREERAVGRGAACVIAAAVGEHDHFMKAARQLTPASVQRQFDVVAELGRTGVRGEQGS